MSATIDNSQSVPRPTRAVAAGDERLPVNIAALVIVLMSGASWWVVISAVFWVKDHFT